MNKADEKARIVKAFAAAAAGAPTIERLQLVGIPASYAAWRVGGVGSSIVLMPALRDDAPSEVWLAYFTRLVANATGVCPGCGEVTDPAVVATLHHQEGCRALFPPVFEQWLVTDHPTERTTQ